MKYRNFMIACWVLIFVCIVSSVILRIKTNTILGEIRRLNKAQVTEVTKIPNGKRFYIGTLKPGESTAVEIEIPTPTMRIK